MSKMMQAVVVAGALTVPMAATSSAQQPIVIGGGLVNVQVGSIQVIDDVVVRDVLNDLTVSVGVAANSAPMCAGAPSAWWRAISPAMATLPAKPPTSS